MRIRGPRQRCTYRELPPIIARHVSGNIAPPCVQANAVPSYMRRGPTVVLPGLRGRSTSVLMGSHRSMERRTGHRYTVDELVYVRAPQGLRAWGMMIDISLAGAFIVCHIAVAAGAALTIDVITTPGGSLVASLEATVCRTNRTGFGVRWHEVSAKTLAQLRSDLHHGRRNNGELR